MSAKRIYLDEIWTDGTTRVRFFRGHLGSCEVVDAGGKTIHTGHGFVEALCWAEREGFRKES